MRINRAAINSVAIDGLKLTSSGGTAYTLTAATGTFTLSGQTAGLRVARRVSAASRAFTVSGQTAGLRVARRVAAGNGAFVVSGQSATLVVRHNTKVTAASGSFALSGQPNTLTRRLHLLAGSGSFALIGRAVADLPAAPQAPVIGGGGSRKPFHGGLLHLQRWLDRQQQVLKKVLKKKKQTRAVRTETERLEVHAMPIQELERIEARAEVADDEHELMLLLVLLGDE